MPHQPGARSGVPGRNADATVHARHPGGRVGGCVEPRLRYDTHGLRRPPSLPELAIDGAAARTDGGTAGLTELAAITPQRAARPPWSDPAVRSVQPSSQRAGGLKAGARLVRYLWHAVRGASSAVRARHLDARTAGNPPQQSRCGSQAPPRHPCIPCGRTRALPAYVPELCGRVWASSSLRLIKPAGVANSVAPERIRGLRVIQPVSNIHHTGWATGFRQVRSLH